MTILFDGIASGMLLFLISVGLSVTLGLMNFVNLAHGAFAMIGGYACVVLLNDYGVPFLATLPFAALVPALVGIVLERTLYRRLYTASDLDQVLFSLGLVFMAVAGAHYFFGGSGRLDLLLVTPSQQVIGANEFHHFAPTIPSGASPRMRWGRYRLWLTIKIRLPIRLF